MKRFLLPILALLLLPLVSFAQERTYSIEIDAKSLTPVQTDPISGVMIDKINPDRSQRPCARIKIHINRMSRDEIAELSVKAIGGNVEVMRQIVARQGNGLIIELTAKDPTRFYLHHPKYGDSNEVSLSLEGDKEYRLEAQLNYMHSVVISSNTINAEVYLDNEFKGRIGDNYTLSISEVLPGQHKIRIQDGSLKTETDVEVSSSSISFRVELNQALARPQYVVFIIEPKEAAITIDGRAIMPNAEGVAQLTLSNGSYKYNVSANEYHPESGEFIVNGAKVVKQIKLRPAFGFLSIPATGDLVDAGVYVDNTLIGKTPISKHKVGGGAHKIRIVKELYKVSEDTVVVSEGENTEYAPSLVADFATVTLSSGEGCEIYVNNERKGISTWSGRLATGAYIFEARKSGHRTSSISETITASQQPLSFTIPAPKPILGSLNVTSSPIMAQVFIDDKLVGETPLMVDVVVGKHAVSARKQGFLNTQKEVTITEGQTTDINITLYKSIGCQMKYTSSNGKVVNPKVDAFGANIVSNTYTNGQGVIAFDRPIKEIGVEAFESCSHLKSITIPDCVIEIGNEAFKDCTSLTSITIPDSVKEIGSGAFEGCSSLTSITIPDSVKVIGAFVFSGCPALPVVDGLRYADKYLVEAVNKSLISGNIKQGTRFIGYQAFKNCKELTKVTIPNSVTNIEHNAFMGCISLKTVIIPSSVATIGIHAFRNCKSLPVYGGLRYVDTYLIEAVDITRSTYTIREGTQYIASEAFSGCTSLTKITIPESVTGIGDKAFAGCSSIKGFYGKFASEDNRCLIVNGVLTAFAPSDLRQYIVPEGVTTIGCYAFSESSSLKSITIPNSVTKISEGAFQHCSSLTNVTIPNGVKKIEFVSFGNCTSLETVTIPENVEKIGIWAFQNCYSLTNIYCKPIAPPKADYEMFTKTAYNCKIYVPSASVEAYKKAEYWKDYAHTIVGEITSGENAQTQEAPSTESAQSLNEKGEELYKQKRYSGAVKWYQKAAEQGDTDAKEKLNN